MRLQFSLIIPNYQLQPSKIESMVNSDAKDNLCNVPTHLIDHVRFVEVSFMYCTLEICIACSIITVRNDSRNTLNKRSSILLLILVNQKRRGKHGRGIKFFSFASLISLFCEEKLYISVGLELRTPVNIQISDIELKHLPVTFIRKVTSIEFVIRVEIFVTYATSLSSGSKLAKFQTTDNN